MRTKPKSDGDRVRSRGPYWLAVLLAISPIPALSQPAGIAPVPARRYQTIPPHPDGERFSWQPGHWNWDAGAERYVWNSGRHVTHHPDRRRFMAGRWVQTGGTWVWRRARWR